MQAEGGPVFLQFNVAEYDGRIGMVLGRPEGRSDQTDARSGKDSSVTIEALRMTMSVEQIGGTVFAPRGAASKPLLTAPGARLPEAEADRIAANLESVAGTIFNPAKRPDVPTVTTEVAKVTAMMVNGFLDKTIETSKAIRSQTQSTTARH